MYRRLDNYYAVVCLSMRTPDLHEYSKIVNGNSVLFQFCSHTQTFKHARTYTHTPTHCKFLNKRDCNQPVKNNFMDALKTGRLSRTSQDCLGQSRDCQRQPHKIVKGSLKIVEIQFWAVSNFYHLWH